MHLRFTTHNSLKQPTAPRGEPKMKRPQFGLRLMLLAVTLIAAVLGLKSAILLGQLKEEARLRDVRLAALKMQLADVENTVAKAEVEAEIGHSTFSKKPECPNTVRHEICACGIV
jgi:hypothetical protein